jgi:outer membrane immunogenic protein
VSRLGISIYRTMRGANVRRMRKSLVVAAGASMLLAGSGWAADLPTRKGPPVAPVYIPPAFTWTGFYVGANVGGGWASRNNNNNVFPVFGAVPVGGTLFLPTSNNGNNSGFVGGLQAGYNYQFGVGQGFVLGLETDLDYSNIFRNRNNNVFLGSFTLPQFPGTVFTPSGLANATRNNNNQYIGTVRVRAGYAWDRFLVYATGGLAYGGIRNNGNGFAAGVTATTAAGFVNPVNGLAGPTSAFIGGVTTHGSSTKTGWTVGAGAEYAIWTNLTIKAEYLYANFGRNKTAPGFFLPGVATAINNTSSINVNLVRVGLNYKFW